jgi:hypothetical protein
MDGPVRQTGMRLLLLLPLALLVACGSSGGDTASPGPDTVSGGGTSRAENDLEVVLDRADGTPVQTWTLTCVGFVEGTHPRAEQACAHLRSVDQPFAPVPEDALCTQQYGGPETARVTGLWGGEPVDLALSRTDGCRIAQWEALGPLLETGTAQSADQ